MPILRRYLAFSLRSMLIALALLIALYGYISWDSQPWIAEILLEEDQTLTERLAIQIGRQELEKRGITDVRPQPCSRDEPTTFYCLNTLNPAHGLVRFKNTSDGPPLGYTVRLFPSDRKVTIETSKWK